MKGINNLFVALLIIAFVVYKISDSFFGDQAQPPHANTTPETTSNIVSYATRIERNDWPPQDDQTSLSDDLLASNYYLVLDGSGSMSESRCSGNQSKMAVAKKALSQFLNQIPESANVGLFVFDKGAITERVPLSPKNMPALTQAVRNVATGGGTPLSKAIDKGFTALTLQAKKQLGYGDYNLVVITDGEASQGYAPRSAVNALLENSPIVLHTIGFCIGDDHSLNQPGLVFYKSADDPASLAAGLNEVLAEMSDFSTLTFEE